MKRVRREDMRFETCCDCGKTYNVCKYAKIPKNRYLCPSCTAKKYSYMKNYKELNA